MLYKIDKTCVYPNASRSFNDVASKHGYHRQYDAWIKPSFEKYILRDLRIIIESANRKICEKYYAYFLSNIIEAQKFRLVSGLLIPNIAKQFQQLPLV